MLDDLKVAKVSCMIEESQIFSWNRTNWVKRDDLYRCSRGELGDSHSG